MRSFRAVAFFLVTAYFVSTNIGCSSGGGSSTGSTPVIVAPAVTSISPASIAAGGGPLTLTVNGTGFESSTTLQVGGTVVTSAFVSSTQMTAAIPGSLVGAGALLSVVASNGASSSGSSVQLAVQNPVPGTITLTPSTVAAGSTAAVVVTVTGSNFNASTVVQVNGMAALTAVVSGTQLTFQLTGAELAAAGSLTITVMNPSPGGGTTAAATLTVAVPTPNPVITQVTPTTVIVNAATTLEVVGTNLTTASKVLWNGTPLATTYYSYQVQNQTLTYLVALVPASLVPNTGTATLTVSTPTALSASNAVTITISDPPPPTVTALSPGGVPLNAATTVQIEGTGFTQNSTVQIDGATITSTYNSATLLSVNFPAQALLGNHSVTVTTPAPGGGVSNTETLTAYIGLQNNAMALNPVNGLLYVSVPSSQGAPYGNSIVPVDPATGAIGKPIPVGSEPDKLAISQDGTTLWVGLDGAAALQEVNLTTGTAGPQYSLGGNAGIYDYPLVVHAIAMLPGSDTSIVASVSTNNGLYEDLLTIFDNGVPRPGTIELEALSSLPAIYVNPTVAEVYATSFETGYQVLSYNSSGLSSLAGNSGTNNYSANYGTTVQVDNGVAYLDTGLALNSETGTLEGTFYSSGTKVAAGPMVSDSTLGKNFILLPASTNTLNSPSYTIQAFNESNYTAITGGAIPVNGPLAGSKYSPGGGSETELDGPNPINTMLRWGSNGIAFRAANGIFSLRSNVVKDLSSTSSDLSLTMSSPANTTTGSTFTATATINNNGPSAATNAVAVLSIPANTTAISISSTQGSCMIASSATCSLGNLSNGSTITLSMVLQAMSAGNAVITGSVQAGESDPNSNNNSSTTTTVVAGNAFAALPVISSLSPNVALAASTDLQLTVNGSGFITGSTVYWGSTALTTSYVSSSQLVAEVPASQMASPGWAAVTISTPAPGGGISSPMPFTIFNALNVSANHILYDPYTRLLYASVNSASTQVTGNSIVSIDPQSSALGTPVAVGSQPSKMALTDDGNYMYINQLGANSVGMLNMNTMALAFSFPVSYGTGYSAETPSLRDIAVLPGSETTVAVDAGADIGVMLFDVNPSTMSATPRANSYGNTATGIYTGTSLQFQNPSTLLLFNSDAWQTLDPYSVTSAGLTAVTQEGYTLNNFSAFKLRNGIAYANAGGVANPNVTPMVPLGVFQFETSNSGISQGYLTNGWVTEPDTSQGISFFMYPTTSTTTTNSIVTLESFNQQTYMPMETVNFPAATTSTTTPTMVDLVRCGPYGLAALRSDGVVILLQGPAVVPGLLAQNVAASLTASSTLTHGSGNTVFTLTGSGLLPGVAVMWNGSFRTTTLVNSSHVTVALPSSDLVNSGSASVTAVNPGAPASTPLTVSIN